MLFQLLLSVALMGTVTFFPYTSPEKDYSLEINENAGYTRDPAANGYTDHFSVTHDTTTNLIDYTLAITRINIGEKITLDDLAGADVKDGFQAKCNCTVTDFKKVKYKGVNGVLFSFNQQAEGSLVKGSTLNIPKGETLYSVSFIATEANFAKYKDEYDRTINSLKILKP